MALSTFDMVEVRVLSVSKCAPVCVSLCVFVVCVRVCVLAVRT